MLYIKRSDSMGELKNQHGLTVKCMGFYEAFNELEPFSKGDFIFDMEDRRLYIVADATIERKSMTHTPVLLVESLGAEPFNLLMSELEDVDRSAKWRHIAADTLLVLALKEVGEFENGLAAFAQLEKRYA